jgi:hypothetical protein
MATTILSPNAKQQFFTDGSTVAAGYLLYTYAANTTTPQATYTNRAGTVANDNPIVLDARGEATIYLTPGVVYDYVLKTDQDVTVWTREDVIADAGDANAVSFLQAGTGAVPRTTQDELRETVRVRQYGAVGDGTTDDTAAIQKAIDYLAGAGGGVVHLGRGNFKISGTLTISSDNVWISGEGPFASRLTTSANTSACLHFTGWRCGIEGFSIAYTAPAAGAVAVFIDGVADFNFGQIFINGCDVGFDINDATIVHGDDFQVTSYATNGVRVRDGSLDVHINSFILNAGNATNGALGGIRLSNFVDAFMAINGDILNGVYSLTTEAATYDVGQRPGNSNFTSVFFDSSANSPAILNDITNTEFIGCWFSGGRTGAGFAGCQIQQSDSLTFTNCRFFNNGSHGVSSGSTSARTTFIGCKADSNGRVAANSAGFHFATCSNWQMIGCRSRNGLFPGGAQAVGISINGASSSGWRVIGGDVTGNATQGVYNESTSGTFSSVVGYVNNNRVVTTANTDANGNMFVNHGLSAAPTVANAATIGHANYVAIVTAVSGSQVTLKIRDVTAAGAQVASTSVTVGVEASF